MCTLYNYKINKKYKLNIVNCHIYFKIKLNICKFTEEQLYSFIGFTSFCIYIMAYCHQPATIRSPFAMASKKFHMPIWIKLLHLLIHICVFANLHFCSIVENKSYSLNKYCKIAYKIMILVACFCTSLFKHLNDFTSG